MDFRHFMGNQTHFGKPSAYDRSFFLLPYYEFSTDGNFAQAKFQHHFEGFLLDKIPLLRRLNWKEVVAFNALYSDRATGQTGETKEMPYWEWSFGLENVGFKAFRMFRFDVASGYFGTAYYRTRLIVGMDF